jgi:hypothetical protein
MNKDQQAVYNVLSTREYTAGAAFTPRLDGVVPRDRIHPILKELEAMNRAELAWGQGWRAIEDPDEFTGNGEERELYREWQQRVAQGLTVLGYPEWVRNTVITMEDEERRRGKGN